MNQVAPPNLPFPAIPELAEENLQEIDFNPPVADHIDSFKREIETLQASVRQLALENESLKQLIDSIYSSPEQKRKFLVVLEKKYKISRRRACRLLSLARSTCWYRSCAAQIEPEEPQVALSSLDTRQLIHRLAKLSRQAQNCFIPLDEKLQEQFEYGLKRIGLMHAALLSRTNLKLAIEIFSVWNKRR